MKRTMRAMFIAIVITTIALPVFARQAAPLPERNTIEVNAFLTVHLPCYPDVASITAEAYHTTFAYWIEERGQALIRGEDIPRLVYSTDDAPGDLDALTVVVEGMPGTTSVLDWTAYPTVTLSPVELRVRAYETVARDIDVQAHPIVDVILSDLTLSTKETCADGMCVAGYLDAERLEAQIVFAAQLPSYDYDPYEEWLAGNSILGEYRIQLPNPFAQ